MSLSTVPAGLVAAPEELAIIRAILRRHVPGLEVWAFGSRVKGTRKPFSDLDLTILSQRPVPLDVQAALREDFTESDLRYKVDLVDWASASASFQDRIRANYVVLQFSSNTIATVTK